MDWETASFSIGLSVSTCVLVSWLLYVDLKNDLKSEIRENRELIIKYIAKDK